MSTYSDSSKNHIVVYITTMVSSNCYRNVRKMPQIFMIIAWHICVTLGLCFSCPIPPPHIHTHPPYTIHPPFTLTHHIPSPHISYIHPCTLTHTPSTLTPTHLQSPSLHMFTIHTQHLHSPAHHLHSPTHTMQSPPPHHPRTCPPSTHTIYTHLHTIHTHLHTLCNPFHTHHPRTCPPSALTHVHMHTHRGRANISTKAQFKELCKKRLSLRGQMSPCPVCAINTLRICM